MLHVSIKFGDDFTSNIVPIKNNEAKKLPGLSVNMRNHIRPIKHEKASCII